MTTMFDPGKPQGPRIKSALFSGGDLKETRDRANDGRVPPVSRRRNIATSAHPAQSEVAPCIRTFFASLPDPRRRRNRIRHPLLNLVVIALCGIIAGADTFEEVEAF